MKRQKEILTKKRLLVPAVKQLIFLQERLSFLLIQMIVVGTTFPEKIQQEKIV